MLSKFASQKVILVMALNESRWSAMARELSDHILKAFQLSTGAYDKTLHVFACWLWAPRLLLGNCMKHLSLSTGSSLSHSCMRQSCGISHRPLVLILAPSAPLLLLGQIKRFSSVLWALSNILSCTKMQIQMQKLYFGWKLFPYQVFVCAGLNNSLINLPKETFKDDVSSEVAIAAVWSPWKWYINEMKRHPFPLLTSKYLSQSPWLERASALRSH